MPRPVAVLTVEELAAKKELVREKRRILNRKYYENNVGYFKEYYQNDRERLCARATERSLRVYYEKKAIKLVAAPLTADL